MHRQKVKMRTDTLHLIPVGDIHYESKLFCKKQWNVFLNRAKEVIASDNTAMFIIMGDSIDGLSTSERKSMVSSGFHETTTDSIDDMYRGIVKQLANDLSILKGHIIGIIGGNHFYQFTSGETSDNMLCRLLGCKFLGCTSFIQLDLVRSGKVRNTLRIVANHGAGGGIRAGTTFNRIEDLAGWNPDADIALMGHNHGLGVMPNPPKFKFKPLVGDKLDVIEHVQYLGRTGSFLRSYVNGEKSYNVDAVRSPTALGFIEFNIKLNISNGEFTKTIKGIS